MYVGMYVCIVASLSSFPRNVPDVEMAVAFLDSSPPQRHCFSTFPTLLHQGPLRHQHHPRPASTPLPSAPVTSDTSHVSFATHPHEETAVPELTLSALEWTALLESVPGSCSRVDIILLVAHAKTFSQLAERRKRCACSCGRERSPGRNH